MLDLKLQSNLSLNFFLAGICNRDNGICDWYVVPCCILKQSDVCCRCFDRLKLCLIIVYHISSAAVILLGQGVLVSVVPVPMGVPVTVPVLRCTI
jgi:hypothetical protein